MNYCEAAMVRRDACSLREAYRSGVRTLAEAGIPNPTLDAAVLLGFAVGMKPEMVIMEGRETVGAEHLRRYGSFISQRCSRLPVSRIIGYREFYSLPFKVNRDVLTPRPETETLVAEGVKFLLALGGRCRVLDIGTGSGAIAVALASMVPESRTIALDISRKALAVASENARSNGVGHRVHMCCSDMADAVSAFPKFDLVVSNPPYIREAEFESLPPEVKRGDPALALMGGKNGLDFYGPIAEAAMNTLRPGGAVMVEAGQGMDQEVSEIFRGAGLGRIFTVFDLGGTGRVVTGRKPIA